MNTQAKILQQLAQLVLAAEEVSANWESGDLAAAVNNLSGEAQEARELLEKMGALKS